VVQYHALETVPAQKGVFWMKLLVANMSYSTGGIIIMGKLMYLDKTDCIAGLPYLLEQIRGLLPYKFIFFKIPMMYDRNCSCDVLLNMIYD
jgi:hypothetical protein